MNFNWIVNLLTPAVGFYYGSRRSSGALPFIVYLCACPACQIPDAINPYFAFREDSRNLHFAAHGLDDTTQSGHIQVRAPINFSDGRFWASLSKRVEKD